MYYQNVSELFLLSVRRRPDKTALVFGEQRLSYREANNRINRIANALLANGVKAGAKVAFLLPNCSCQMNKFWLCSMMIYFSLTSPKSYAFHLKCWILNSGF